MDFRPQRRQKRALTELQAMDLLEQEKRAVLAVNGDNGYPYAIPVNYYYDRPEGKIYFHGAAAGHKADAIRRCDKVCFTVYGNEHRRDDDWAPYVQSTVVFGRCRVADKTPETMAKLRAFALRYYPSADEADAEIAADGAAVTIYEITIEHITGKQIHEK